MLESCGQRRWVGRRVLRAFCDEQQVPYLADVFGFAVAPAGERRQRGGQSPVELGGVVYRGTRWNGELASAQTPRRDTMYIVATRGSTLVLDAERP